MSEVIKQIESSVSSLEEQVKMINNTYKTNTDLIGKGVDHLVGIFGGETVEKIYADQMVGIQKQAKLLLSKLHTETLTEQQKIRLERLKDGKLEDVGIVQMARNTDLKQAVVNGIYGVKGEITGTLHGLKIMITGVLDLAVFMAKYGGSMLGIHPEYKIKINDQATKLFDWIKKEGRIGVQDKMFELVEQEMMRISKLPQENQAEAIGNIAGNVIGMLTGVKTGITLVTKSGEMAGKVAQAARITQKLAKRVIINTTRMTQVGNLGKQAGYIRIGSTVAEKMLNGLAESLIGYGFAKGLSATWELIRNSTVSASKKLSSMEKIITEMEETLKTETNPKQREVIQEEIRKLREEKVKIQRPNQNLDEIKSNASLLPEARIKKAESLLGGKILSEKQKSTILHIHENMSKGIFANDYISLGKMNTNLKNVGFDKEDIRILIENGILGFGMRTVSRTDGITDHAIGKLSRVVLPNERLERGGLYDHSKTSSDADIQVQQLRKRIGRDQEKANKKETILENAKQVGAKLFVLGEDIMKKNPNLTGSELKELILKKASENSMTVSLYQHRVLDRQAEIYDTLKLKLDEKLKGWFNKAGIVMPENPKQIEELLNSNDALRFEVGMDVFSIFFTNKDQENKFLLGIAMKTQDSKIGALSFSTNTKRILTIIEDVRLGKNIESADIDWFRNIRDNHESWTGIIKDIFKLKLININISDFPLKIATSIDENIFGFFNGKAEYDSSVLGLEKGGTYIYKSSRAGSDTFDHEYQHFLNKNFLYPEVLYQDSSINRNGVTTDIANRKIGRELFAHLQDVNLKGKIWQSMQDELCSYIERNNQLPKDLNPYFHSGLKDKFRNGEIPKEHIQKMEGAIRELELYFDNPKVPREDLVGVIRTSYSVEDMLDRLRKKYMHLLSDTPYAQLLKIL